MITNFLYLLFTHFMADFAFQSDFMSKFKYKLPYVMFVHCFIWTFALFAIADLLCMRIPDIIWPFMFGLHFVVDYYKCFLIDRKYDNDLAKYEKEIKRLFHIDQFIHIGQIVILSLF